MPHDFHLFDGVRRIFYVVLQPFFPETAHTGAWHLHSARVIPFFQISAIQKTVCFILLVIIVLGISNGRFLFQTSLMNLVRYEKKAEKSMKFHFLPALLGLVMTLTGYVLALDIFRGRKSLWFSVGFYQTGLLTAMLILLGTVFFISSFLPCVMKCSKKNKRAFYTQTRIITTPVFVYRVRSNASTLIMLTLLSAATLTVASVMALTLYDPIACISRMAPSELEFRVANEHQADAAKRLVNQYAPNGAVTFTQTDIYKITSSSDSLPMEYSVGTAKGDAQNETILREAGFECISYIGLLVSAAVARYQRICAVRFYGSQPTDRVCVCQIPLPVSISG